MDDNLEQQLRLSLQNNFPAGASDDPYQVDSILAESQAGRTELVHTADGTRLIRKYLSKSITGFNPYAVLVNLHSAFFPHITALYESEDSYVVIMDYCQGETLQESVDARGPYSPAAAIAIIEWICVGIGEFHALTPPLIHRDIKPANIILSRSPEALRTATFDNPPIRIIDLGISRAYKPGEPHDTRYQGTRGYAAPEQFGYAQTDARTDIYSIGATLYFLLTGESPDSPQHTFAQRAGLDPRILAIVRKCTAFAPDARFQSVAELLNALNGLSLQPSRQNPLAGQGSSSSVPLGSRLPQIPQIPQNRSKLNLLWRIPVGILLSLIALVLFQMPFTQQMWVLQSYGAGTFAIELILDWAAAVLVILPALVLTVNPLRIRDRIAWFRKNTKARIAATLAVLFGIFLVLIIIFSNFLPGDFYKQNDLHSSESSSISQPFEK
jgi:serine/threonine protein kinase